MTPVWCRLTIALALCALVCTTFSGCTQNFNVFEGDGAASDGGDGG